MPQECIRICLRCGEKFKSAGKFNRLCEVCVKANNRLSTKHTSKRMQNGRGIQDNKESG